MLKKTIVFLLLLLMFFVASRSFFKSEFFYVHDFTQGARIVEMSNALREGHFPVRWSSNFGFGYGMPLFEFYAPLPYYVGSLFYLVGFSLVNSIKILFLISTFVTLIGGYKLGKILFGRGWGLVLAVTLTLAPYRAVNLFVRGAISELWGIMALPFILYGIVGIIKNKKNSWITLLISLLVLLLSHNLTTLIFLPLSIVFGGAYLLLDSSNKEKSAKIKRKFFLDRFLILAGVYLLSFLISAFYLLPALLEKDYTRLESAILGNYFDYNLHFVYIKQFFEANWKYGGSSWGPYDEMSFYLGAGQLIGLGLSGFLVVKNISKKLSQKFQAGNCLKRLAKIFDQRLVLYLASVSLFLISIFMTLNRSKFIWDKFELLSFIQFPWRWLSAGILFLSIVIGFSGKFIKSKFHRYLFALIIILITIFSNYSFFQPEKYLEDSSEFYYSDTQKIREEMSQTLPDFIPSQMMGEVLSPTVTKDAMFICELEIKNRAKGTERCNFQFTKLLNKGHKKIVEVRLTEATMLEFAVADFPGWRVEVDSLPVDHGVSEFGTILVPVDVDKHTIVLEFKNSEIRKIADLSSLLGLVIFSSILTWQYVKLKRSQKH
jgi:hypothetical protein